MTAARLQDDMRQHVLVGVEVMLCMKPCCRKFWYPRRLKLQKQGFTAGSATIILRSKSLCARSLRQLGVADLTT